MAFGITRAHAKKKWRKVRKALVGPRLKPPPPLLFRMGERLEYVAEWCRLYVDGRHYFKSAFWSDIYCLGEIDREPTDEEIESDLRAISISGDANREEGSGSSIRASRIIQELPFVVCPALHNKLLTLELRFKWS